MHFAAHGSYKVKVEGNILIIDAIGPFNEKIVEQYENDINTSIEQFDNQPWMTLVIYHGNGIFTPSAEKECIRMTKFRARHGMIANASVIINSVHADLQHMQLNRIYKSANVPAHVFSDVCNAKLWLSNVLETQSATC